MYLIETNNLCKKYGNSLVIDHVSMHVPEHSIYGFVGENGSGKTTIMRLLTGLAEVTSGSFTLFGYQNNDRKINEAKKQVSAIVEIPALVPSLSARDNMIYQELYLGVKLSDEERDNLIRLVNLESAKDKKVRNYSLGMRQRLAIALALISKPKLMFLDEPMNGLDPEGIAELRQLLIDLNKNEGITILISSHILSELEKIATNYGFISHGHLIEEITTEELQNRCRKSIILNVNDVNKAEEVLKKILVKSYQILPNGDVTIYDEVKIKDVVLAMTSNDVEVLNIHSKEESVEDYYLNLIKNREAK